VLNHLNLANPVLAIDNPSVGQITSARPADFGGNRTGQVGARVEFSVLCERYRFTLSAPYWPLGQ
jgi:hypothetical protein